MCPTGKREFESAGQARNAAAKITKRRSVGSRSFTGKMWAYRCTLCPLWHLTSQDQSVRR